MGYSVSGRIEISIFINNVEYPLSMLNVLNFCHIGTLAQGALPTCHFGITDVGNNMDNAGLQADIPIRIVIKAQGLNSKTYLFRKFDSKRKFNGAAFDYTIDGYWDSPLYYSGTTQVGIAGTSNAAIQQIMSKCGISYDGLSTSDSMLWMPQNRKYKDFAKHVIASRAFASSTSCMKLGMGLDGVMRFKDVNNLPMPTQSIIAYQNKQGFITAMDYTSVEDSGFSNLTSGYFNARYEQSSVSSQPQSKLNTIAFTTDSNSPLYNMAMTPLVQRGSVRFGPIDVGNVHSNYELASYQNMRYSNMFNNTQDLLLINPSTFQMFERVNFTVMKPDGTPNIGVSGIYTVTGHALLTQGANYAEKLRITRHGTNLSYVSG